MKETPPEYDFIVVEDDGEGTAWLSRFATHSEATNWMKKIQAFSIRTGSICEYYIVNIKE